MHTSSNEIRLGNMGTHHPSKEQASSRTNKDEREYIPEQKTNIRVREKTKFIDMIEQIRRRKWTWAGHVSRVKDNRWPLRSTTWKPYERNIPRGIPVRRLLEGYHLAEDSAR